MKNRSFRAAAVIFVLISLVTLLSGCYFLPEEEPMLAPPLKEPEAVTYKTHEVALGTIERHLDATGKVESTESEVLFFKGATGRLKGIYVKAGDTVEAGTLIAELDTGDLEYTIYKQEMAVRSAEITLELASATTQPDPVAVERAQINYDLASQALTDTRTARSTASDAAEKQEFDRSIERQTRELRLLELTLQQVKKGTQPNAAEMERAQINYDLAARQLEIYREQLAEAQLYASMGGLVTYVTALEPGDSVSTYYDLVKIANAVALCISFSSSDYSELDIGTVMEVTFKGTNPVTMDGRVVQLPTDVPVTATEIERTTVKLEVDEIPEGFGIGSTVGIKLLLERRENIVVLPQRYVTTYSSRHYVRILNDEGIPEERDVKKGIDDSTNVEILSGLEPGEIIVY